MTTGAFAGTVYASGHSVQTPIGDHILGAEGEETENGQPPGIELWWGFFTGETDLSAWPWDFSICDYQGQIAVYNPDGSFSGSVDTSSVNNGCSLQAWKTHPSLNNRQYAENKRFRAKWKSNTTNHVLRTIGTMQD